MNHHLPRSLFFTTPTIAPATYFQTPIRLQSFGCFTIRCTGQFHLQVRKPECNFQKRVVNFDSLLSAMELSCLVSSSIFSVAMTVNVSKNWVTMVSGNRVNAAWGILLLAGGVASEVLLRRRQWNKIVRENMKGGLIMERVEKVEEDLRRTVRVIRILWMHIEKLERRFKVNKEPITQSAAIAQKNSEATRGIAVQYEILEKEIHEIQKVLLAIEEQQQKQFDLIISLKSWERKRKTPKEQDILQTTTNLAEDEVIKQVEDHKPV